MPDGRSEVLGWSSLLRRLLRILVGFGVREVVRQGRRAARSRRGAGADGSGRGERPTIIDVERVDRDRPFERFSEPARRIVARAAAHQDGAGLTGEALLLATIDTDQRAAQELASAGTDLDALRSHLREASPGQRRGVTPEARRALREARGHADRRAVGAPVTPRDLLAALLFPGGPLAAVVDRHTVGALGYGPGDGA